MLKNYKEKLKYHFQEVIRTKKSSHSIALGAGIGTFISILPTPGLNLLIGFLVVLAYKKVNKYSLFITLFFWNTLTLSPIYFVSFQIGDFLFGELPTAEYKFTIQDRIYNFTRRFLAGNFIMAVTVSVTSYFIVRRIIDQLRVKKIIKESEER